MGGGLESRSVGRVYGAGGAVAAAFKNTTHRQTRCRKPYAATQPPSDPDDVRIRPKHVELRIHQ